MAISGRVVEEQKNYYIVNSSQGNVRATTRGLLKKDKKRLCVGDFVDLEVTNTDPPEGKILKVHERTSFLARPPLANITHVLYVCTAKEPPLDLEATDRFLLCASAYGLVPIIIFNKIDLVTPSEQPFSLVVSDAYRTIGYKVLMTSALTGAGMRDLTEAAIGRVSAFAGLSGVGKSALMQRLFPERNFRVGEVSGPQGRGTHTTTSVTLLPLEHGGFIADTPGISFVTIPLVPEEDVATYFPELEGMIGKCKFNNCIHDNEPGCSVRARVEAGEIAAWRVEHYLKMYREMKERRRAYKDRE